MLKLSYRPKFLQCYREAFKCGSPGIAVVDHQMS